MSWQTCIACRAGIWSHLPTLWPGWLGADWCYLACFGNQFLSATHLYPKTIVAWFRVVSCLVEKHVFGDFFGLQYVLSLPNWQRCWRNWMSSPCPWLGLSHDFVYFSQLNLLQIKLMTRRLQCSESRGRMSWKRPACLMPVLYESSMLYSLQSLHGQAIKRRLSLRWLQKWTRLPGSCDSCGTWKVEVPDKYHRKTWDLTSIPSANPWSYMWKWSTYNL